MATKRILLGIHWFREFTPTPVSVPGSPQGFLMILLSLKQSESSSSSKALQTSGQTAVFK